MRAWAEAEAAAAWRFRGSCLGGSRGLRSGAQMGDGAGAGARRRLVSAREAEGPRCPPSMDLLNIIMGLSSRLGEAGGSRSAARFR